MVLDERAEFEEHWKCSTISQREAMAALIFKQAIMGWDNQYTLPVIERAFQLYADAFEKAARQGHSHKCTQYGDLLEILTAVLTVHAIREEKAAWFQTALRDNFSMKEGVKRAVRELVYVYIQRTDLEGLGRLLDHPNRIVRDATNLRLDQGVERLIIAPLFQALRNYRAGVFGDRNDSLRVLVIVDRCESIELLDWIYARVDQYFAAWQKKQSPSALQSPETLGRCISAQRAMNEIARGIAKRKSELAKTRDGELLAGETIVASKTSGPRIYRIAGRCSR